MTVRIKVTAPLATRLEWADVFRDDGVDLGIDGLDPGNGALQAFAAKVGELRAAGQPTVPSRLSDELAANPFMRAPDVTALADLRSRKDKF